MRFDRACPFLFSVVLIGCGAAQGAVGSESSLSDETAFSEPALGATVEGGGVTFGVWAPNADQVFVVGSFNGWKRTNELVRGSGGVFTGHVAGAKAGDEYKFVIRNGSSWLWRSDPRARQMRGEDGNSVVVDTAAFAWTDAGFTPAKPSAQVIYELHVPSFSSDAGGPGTWRSAIDKLDYLASLGINVIETLPHGEYASHGGWGYNPTELFAPESDYGTPADLQAFVDAAHQHGIAVILDWVPNHMSSTHTPMKDFDGASLGADGIYYYTDGRAHTSYGPRPNYDSAQVADWLSDAMAEWLDAYHFDGARVDSVITARKWSGGEIPGAWKLFQRVNDEAHARGGKVMIAEDLQNFDAITAPTDDGKTRGSYVGGAGFDAQWDNSFYSRIKAEVVKAADIDRDVTSVRDAIAHLYHGRATERVIFTEDHDKVCPQHDTERLPREISPLTPDDYVARKRSTLAAAVLFTSPGVPMIFQGQELLEQRGFDFPVPALIDWPNATTYSGIVALYHALIQMRTVREDTRGLRGDHVDVFHVNSGAKVLAYHRWDQGGAGDDVIVVANLSDKYFPIYRIGFPSEGVWRVRFNSDSTKYSPDFDGSVSGAVTAVAGARDGLPFHGDVGVGPYTVVVLSQ